MRGEKAERHRRITRHAAACSCREILEAHRTELPVEVDVAAGVELDPGGVHEQRHDRDDDDAREHQGRRKDRIPVHRGDVRRQDRRPKAGIGTHRHDPARRAQSLRRNGEGGDHEVVGNQGNEHRERKDQGVLRSRLQKDDQSGEGHAEGALQRHARIKEEMEGAKADRIAGDDTECRLAG